MNSLNRDHKFTVDMAYREDVLSSIAKMIEAKCKRGKPKICEYREFERNKNEITDEIKRSRHFCERDWPESEKIFLELKKTVVEELETVSSESENEFVSKKSHARKPISIASRSFRRSRSGSPR
jgi:seryl-tRNA synthetase